MSITYAGKITELPLAGVVASVTVGASAGLGAAAWMLPVNPGPSLPALAVVGAAATALFLLRARAHVGWLFSTVVAVATAAALAMALAAVSGSLAADLSLGVSVVTLGALAFTGDIRQRVTTLVAATPAASAMFFVAFANTGAAAVLSNWSPHLGVAAWAYAVGNMAVAVLLARAYGIARGGGGTKQMRAPLTALAVVHGIAAVLTYTATQHTGRGFIVTLLVTSLVTLTSAHALTAVVYSAAGHILVASAVGGSAGVTLSLAILGTRDDRMAHLLVMGVLALLACAIVIFKRVQRRRSSQALPEVTPKTFSAVAFAVPEGVAGAVAVGPLPSTAPGAAPDVSAAVGNGESVVIQGNRAAARRVAASVAAEWLQGDSLVVWADGSSQDRIDNGLARGVEAVVRAGGAKGPIYETIGAARLAHRYFRAFPGPVLVIVDGWSAAALERCDPELWGGAASLIILGGTYPGARAIVASEPSPPDEPSAVTTPSPWLVAATLAGAPHVPRRVLSLITPGESVDSSLAGHLAAGTVRECGDGTAICVREDVADRWVATWVADGTLAGFVLPLLEKVAALLPEHGADFDPRGAMRELADAGVALWERGRDSFGTVEMESAALAMHRVVIALEQSSDVQRTNRLALDVQDRVCAIPGITPATSLQARVDAVATATQTSLPPRVTQAREALVVECLAVLGEHQVTTCRAQLAWVLGTWPDRPRLEVIRDMESVASRITSALGPEAPLALIANRWESSIRALLNSSSLDTDALVEQGLNSESALPRPSTQLPESLIDLAVILGDMDREPEAWSLTERAIAILADDYGDLHPLLGDALSQQLTLAETTEQALLRGIELHPLIELVKPWTMTAIATPMRWVQHYQSRGQDARVRALLESVAEHLERASPPESPSHDAYLQSLRWTHAYRSR